MKHISEFIVKHRKVILIISILLLIPSWLGFQNTRVNYDILSYLPDDLDSTRGQTVLDEDFHSASIAVISLENMDTESVTGLETSIQEIDGVNDAMWVRDITEDMPSDMLPDKIRKMVDNGTCQLMMVTFDEGNGSDSTIQAIDDIEQLLDSQIYLGGMSPIIHDLKALIDEQLPIYILIAVTLALIVLEMGISYTVAPFIFLAGIGMAIVYNAGTNIIFGQISFITQSLSAVLQLAVSMDFSIFLLSRYDEELAKGKNSEQAMSSAIELTFSSIAGSSLTTIAGFLAMCTMELTLGTDMGLVMAKGVLLGVLSTVVILPCLILAFDRQIHKYQHKTIIPTLNKTAEFTNRHYKAIFVIALALLIPFGIAQSKNDVYYNLMNSLPDDMISTEGTQKMRDEFGMTTSNFILVDEDMDSVSMSSMLSEIEDTDGITSVAALDAYIGGNLPSDFLPSEVKDMFQAGGYKMILANSSYESATDQENAQIEQLESIVKSYDANGLVTGEGALNRDLVTIADHDISVVNIVSILMVFIIIAVVFKSWSIPILLVGTIEIAITINMGIPYFINESIPFIASIVIGTIQLGATIDYAILMTTRYREERNNGYSRSEAVLIATKQSSHSILVSGLSFFGATVGVAFYSNVDLISCLCGMLAIGVLISRFTILLVLPSVLLIFGGLMEKTSYHFINKKTEA